MRKFQPWVITIVCLLTWQVLSAQDTTAFRFAGFSDGGELILFRDDSTNLFYGPINTNASYNALFHHRQLDKLYCLYDSVQGNGRRDIYEIDPFSNTMSFVFSPSATFLSAACVGPYGIVYAVTGNGGPGPGAIYAIDLQAGTETLFATTDLGFGGGNQVAANISYYPPTDELYLFGGAVDSLIKINVSTQVETRVAVGLNGDGAIKATYLDGNLYWLLSDQSYTFDASSGGPLQPSTFVIPDFITDIELLDMVMGGDTIAICSNDSALLRSRFRFDDYHWYLNGQPVPSNGRTLITTTPGTYQLLAQFDTGNLFIWSETVELVAQIAPMAGFGYSPSAPIVNVPVVFTDSSLNANIYAWNFGDGNFSAASNPSHTYTTSGTYTVMQVVQNDLCIDTAFVTIVVTTGVGTTMAIASSSLTISPNPAHGEVLFTATTDAATYASLFVFNAQGQPVFKLHEGPLEAGVHRFEMDTHATVKLEAGIYLIQLQTETGRSSQRLVILR